VRASSPGLRPGDADREDHERHPRLRAAGATRRSRVRRSSRPSTYWGDWSASRVNRVVRSSVSEIERLERGLRRVEERGAHVRHRSGDAHGGGVALEANRVGAQAPDEPVMAGGLFSKYLSSAAIASALKA
jgi:hypothetical protein